MAGDFMAVNRVGRELWRINLGKPISFPAVIGWDGRLFIPVGSLVICRTASGLPLWTTNLGSPVAMPPVLDHAGGIATYLENHDFIRVNHLGAVARVRLENQPAIIVPLLKAGASPGIDTSGNSYLLLYQSGEAEHVKVDLSGDTDALVRNRLARLPASPVSAAGHQDEAAVTIKDGRVFLVDPAGRMAWTGNSHETTAEKGSANLNALNTAMTFDERGIFIMTHNGVTAFTKGGRRRWLFRYPETSAVTALSNEGLVYACGRDNIIRTYKIDNQVRNLPRSMYGPDPEGTYGLGNPPPSPWARREDRFGESHIKQMTEEIEKATAQGNVGENEPLYVAYLMEMIGYFLNNPHGSLVRAPIKVPQRIEFLRLLSRMGSRETIRFLVTIYNRDPEPSIKAACCEAIGRIGVDPKGEAVQAYSFLLSRDNANRDSQTLLSASDSIAALCRFSGPPLAADGILLLTQIARFPDFRSDVKKRAQDQLNALRIEGLDKAIQ
jgi:outer membrane protein assembly factor BamB